MKTKFNEVQLARITAIQQSRGIPRKSAIKEFQKELKSAKAPRPVAFSRIEPRQPATNPLPVTLATATPVTPRNAAIALNQEKALKPEVAADYKARAANDDTTQAPAQAAAQTTTKAPEATTKKAATPKPPVPSTPAGDARKEGIRLFQLAEKPTKQDFIYVYGEMGAKWTWAARAKAVGLNTAEEAAKEFRRMRAGQPRQFVKAEPTEKK